MDITSLYLFTEVAKDLHITRTANRLYMSQQTLSNHILRLEEQFNARLLVRKPRMSLTYAGEQVLAFANMVLKEQTNLNDTLSDIELHERGAIRFGASAMRMDILNTVFPEFTARYPNVELRLTSVISQDLEPQVTDGELDLAIVVSDRKNPELRRELLMQDQLYLCVPDLLMKQYYGEEAHEIKLRSADGARLKDFQRLPFCLFTNEMGQRIRSCFEEAGYRPRVLMTTGLTQICTSIGFTGAMAFFSSHANLIGHFDEIPRDMNVFPLLYEENPMFLNVSLICHKKRYLTRFTRYFMELLSKHAAEAAQTPVTRMAEAG